MAKNRGETTAIVIKSASNMKGEPSPKKRRASSIYKSVPHLALSNPVIRLSTMREIVEQTQEDKIYTLVVIKYTVPTDSSVPLNMILGDRDGLTFHGTCWGDRGKAMATALKSVDKEVDPVFKFYQPSLKLSTITKGFCPENIWFRDRRFSMGDRARDPVLACPNVEDIAPGYIVNCAARRLFLLKKTQVNYYPLSEHISLMRKNFRDTASIPFRAYVLSDNCEFKGLAAYVISDGFSKAIICFPLKMEPISGGDDKDVLIEGAGFDYSFDDVSGLFGDFGEAGKQALILSVGDTSIFDITKVDASDIEFEQNPVMYVDDIIPPSHEL